MCPTKIQLQRRSRLNVDDGSSVIKLWEFWATNAQAKNDFNGTAS